jgi:4-amino-4-deoxy-L-arabinose transferase-like glycosyltransferase
LGGLAGLGLVLALTLFMALPGFFSLPPVDRDEVLFAQASRQMLASGDVIDIRFADQPRYKKPVGIYWLQAAAAAATGQPGAIWSYRLVSLAGVLLAVGMTWGVARRALVPGAAVLAAMILGSCLLIGGEARLAKTDAMLLGAIMVGQWVLARAWLPGGRGQVSSLGTGTAAVFWAALAATILIKGPIGPMVLGFTLGGLCLMRRDLALLRALQPGRGLALLAVLVLPWVIAITVKSQGAFWTASVGHDLMGKLVDGQESHGAPPGIYLAAVWVTFWPGSMLLLAALPGLWAARREPVAALALVWVVPAWIVFELTKTKLVHYVLPTYPALALMVALGLTRGPVWRGAAWVLAPVPLIVMVALAVLAQRLGVALPLTFWPLAVMAILLAAAVPLALRRGGVWSLSAALALAGGGLSLAVYPTLADSPGLWPARRLATLAVAHPGCTLTVAGYAEPSLVFWTNAAAHLATPAEALAALTAPGCQIVAVPAAEAQPALPVLTQVTGLDLGSGRAVDLSVYLKAE